MHDNASGSGADRKQLPILAALAWARTRDAEITYQAESVTPIRLSLVIACWAQDHAEEGQALDGLWMSRDEAEDALLALLRSGGVEAQGVLRDSFLSAFHPIPSASWHVLQLNLAGQPYAEGLFGGRYERWDHILLNAEHIYAAFPRTHATRLEKLAADRAEAEQRFDPMAQLRWSVPMTVAWIATREVSDVQRVWDEFRHEVGEDEADLEHLSPIEWQAVTDAWRDLRRAAEAGTVAAQGIDEQSGHGIALSAAVWRNMTFVSKPAGMTCVPKGSKSGYRDVTFARSEIIGLWLVEAPLDAGAYVVDDNLESETQDLPALELEPHPAHEEQASPALAPSEANAPADSDAIKLGPPVTALNLVQRILEDWDADRQGRPRPQKVKTRDYVMKSLGVTRAQATTAWNKTVEKYPGQPWEKRGRTGT